MSDTLIQVSDLTIRNSKGILLDNISFNVAAGEIFVILGGSGCGKSTLLKHLIGQYSPHAGDIQIAGQSIVKADTNGHREIMQGVGVLYQSGALFGSMTLIENVSLPLEEHTDLPTSAIRMIARQKLADVGLVGFENYLPDKISGGMKKRAGLARAMALGPPLLFLDEPSAGLDPVSSAELDNLILDLRSRFGVTMVIVTHELDSIFRIADRVIILQRKIIAAQGPVDEVRRNATDRWIKNFFSRGGTKTDH